MISNSRISYQKHAWKFTVIKKVSKKISLTVDERYADLHKKLRKQYSSAIGHRFNRWKIYVKWCAYL